GDRMLGDAHGVEAGIEPKKDAQLRKQIDIEMIGTGTGFVDELKIPGGANDLAVERKRKRPAHAQHMSVGQHFRELFRVSELLGIVSDLMASETAPDRTLVGFIKDDYHPNSVHIRGDKVKGRRGAPPAEAPRGVSSPA